MVSRQTIEQQLHHIGFNPFTWGRSEVRELCNIMMDDEEIVECVNGEYNNGFALMAATNHRVLLVDKKPFLYLTVEDVRFEQISDFNFRNRFLTATVTISTSNKTLYFMSYNKKRLRRLITCVQRRVVDLRERQRSGYRSDWQPAPQLPLAPAPPQLAQPTTIAAVATQDSPTGDDPPVLLHNHPHLTRIATYTRSKIPSLHHHQKPAQDTTVHSGDVYQQGYAPGSVPDYQAPA
jgi:hypothetical protein